MSWLPIIALAALAFALAVFALRLPRPQWMLFAAALLFGLAGYGAQGSPGRPSAPAPAAAAPQLAQTGEMLVAARRELYDANALPSRFVVTADAFARRGQFDQAAQFLRNAVEENPSDSEAWVALGLMLVEHAQGRLTPAALHAFRRAEAENRGSPAPAYFLGLALLREGRMQETRAMWSRLLDSAPAQAPWRPALQARLERLDAMLGQTNSVAPPGFPQ